MTKRDRNIILAAAGFGGAFLCVVLAAVVGIVVFYKTKDKQAIVFANGFETSVHYDKTVTEDEAMKLAKWMNNLIAKDNRSDPIPAKLTRRGSTYEVRLILKKGIESDPEFTVSMKATATQASRDVFGGAPCDFVGCDDNWKDLRVYPGGVP